MLDLGLEISPNNSNLYTNKGNRSILLKDFNIIIWETITKHQIFMIVLFRSIQMIQMLVHLKVED